MTEDAPTLWRVTLRALPSTVPVVHRVRSLLKIALRALGLRCVKVEQVPAPGREAK